MTPFRTCASFAAAILYAAILPCHAVVAQVVGDSPTDNSAGQTRIVFSHALPPLDGGHLNVTVVEITYGPGESSPPHSHPCAVVGYVIEGALRTQVNGEAEAIYKTGESFYEPPQRRSPDLGQREGQGTSEVPGILCLRPRHIA